MEAGHSVEASHVGAADPAPNTTLIKADGDDRLAGFVLAAVPAGTALTIQFMPIRRVQILCFVSSELSASQWNMTSLKVGESEKINAANVTVTPPGAPAFLQDTGVNLTAFLPFATCADVVAGDCLKQGVPLTIQVVNRSVGPAGLAMTMRGRTFKKDDNANCD